jgi:hypothetical protein
MPTLFVICLNDNAVDLEQTPWTRVMARRVLVRRGCSLRGGGDREECVRFLATYPTPENYELHLRGRCFLGEGIGECDTRYRVRQQSNRE